MARRQKNIIIDGVNRREVGYYSTPGFVADFISKEMLAINPDGHYVLDPAVGKEELLHLFHSEGKEIDSFDIVDYGIHKLASFSKENFIEYFIANHPQSLFCSPCLSKYDYIIANPPYNCHEVDYIRQNKGRLKNYFPVGTYNMYSMFLSALIDIAKEGCTIGVVISDSFLTATYHAKLREKIVSECSIHDLILCPSDLFWNQQADVRTCILILQKGKQYQSLVKVGNRPPSKEKFAEILHNQDFTLKDIDDIQLKAAGHQFIIDIDKEILRLFKEEKNVGESYKCVTCISTGNDAKYLREKAEAGYSIPFYKNPATRKFSSTPDAYLIDSFLEQSAEDKNFMVRNKDIIDQEGIVCSSMGLPFSAAYLPPNGVAGVNASIYPPHRDIAWMLSYLNSSLVTYIVRGILIRSNMVTSGYIATIPLLNFSESEKETLANICLDVMDKKNTIDNAISEINDIIYSHCNFGEELIEKINTFSRNISVSV